jgi:glycosyltransferase involved in cell wall biosynthesis
LPFPHKERFYAEVIAERDFHTIAYLSNVDADAGAFTMLELAQLLPDYRIIMAVRKFADSYEREVEKFAQKVAERKVRNVEIVRNIADIGAFYKKVGVVVVPVIDERATMDMPMVLVEALASGTKVVVNRLPIFEPLVVGGLVESFGNVSELADCIRNASDTYLRYADRGLIFTEHLPTMSESVQHYLEYMDCI